MKTDYLKTIIYRQWYGEKTGCFFLQYTKISISCSHTPWPVRAKTLYITCLGGYVREIFFFICGSNLNSLDHGGGFGFNLRQC